MVVLALAGCALAGSAHRQLTYRKALPNATANDLVEKTRLVLDRNGFLLERAEQSTYVFVETRWLGRYPFQDEIDAGVVEAMTRISVRGRPRGRMSPGTVNLQISELTAENMVRLEGSLEWERGFFTPMFKAYIDEIVDDLSTELQRGVRVF